MNPLEFLILVSSLILATIITLALVVFMIWRFPTKRRLDNDLNEARNLLVMNFDVGRWIQKNLNRRERKFGRHSGETLAARGLLADAWLRRGSPTNAIALYELNYEIVIANKNHDGKSFFSLLNAWPLARLYTRVHDLDKAVKLYMECLKRSPLAPSNRRIMLDELAEVYERLGTPENAIPLREEQHELSKNDRYQLLKSIGDSTRTFVACGVPHRAIDLCYKYLQAGGLDRESTEIVMRNCAFAYMKSGLPERAIPLYELRGHIVAEHEETGPNTWSKIGLKGVRPLVEAYLEAGYGTVAEHLIDWIRMREEFERKQEEKERRERERSMSMWDHGYAGGG
ncbi:tetratricopeptide repeat protein [Glycomyces xiaoerkulensis]|uniref:tetratricopeptide repeat protein n=1 Tax=Glycomyces xiaoerkulensis TaxID=2038139 RepID=UPI0012FFE4A8|nr:tetratricopeptide repeat protein [Glycomyces xiaoerkulensis]